MYAATISGAKCSGKAFQGQPECAAKLTLQAYRSDLKAFLTSWEAIGLPAAIYGVTNPMVRRCLTHFQAQRTCKPSSLNRRHDTSRSLFRYAHEQGYIERDPMERIRSPKADKSLPVYLREAELLRLLSAVERKGWKLWQRDKAVLSESVISRSVPPPPSGIWH